MQSVAMGVYLQTTTHNPTWLGLVTMAGWMPSLLASPIGGALADRRRRQFIIQLCNTAMALAATALAVLVLTERLTPGIAVSLAIVEGFASAASWASWQSLLRDLVDVEEVMAAVSLSSAQFNLGRVIGPLAAGVLMAVGSPGWCFVVNAITFYFVVIAYMGVRSRPREIAPTDHKLFEQIRHGALTAWRTPGTRSPIVLVAVVAFTLSPFIAFVPTMAIEIFHAGATGTSWLVTAQGVGAVIAAIGMPSIARRTSRLAVIEGSVLVMIAATAAYAVAPSLPLSVMAMVVLGGAYIGALTGLNSTVQLLAPAAERSRILSLYTMSLSLAYPLGALLQSFVVKGWGLRETTVSSAVVMGIVVLYLRWRRPDFFRAMAATEK